MVLLDFGKHKGESLDDVPLEYVVFLAGYRFDGANRIRSESSATRWVKNNRPEIHTAAMKFLENKCWHCGGKLVPVGYARLGGASHEDWDGRFLHKKCWKSLIME